jgi:hypothetical protein
MSNSANTVFEYDGYYIRPTNNQLQNGKWDLEIQIEKHEPDRMIVKSYSAASQFDTYEQSLAACKDFGIRIINGEVGDLKPPG